MTAFGELLRETGERLDLPQPARARLLLEIAGDLEDLHAHYLAQGLDEETARARAAEMVDLSDAALAELVRLHASGYRRLMDRLGEQARSRWERGLFALLLLFLAIAAGRAVLTIDLFAPAHLVVWPILAVTLAAVALAVRKLHALYLRQRHDPRHLRAGLGAIPVLAGLDLVLGFAGQGLELLRIAVRIRYGPEGTWAYLVEGLFRSSATVIVGLLAALFTALIWHLLADRVARIEQAEAAQLMRIHGRG